MLDIPLILTWVGIIAGAAILLFWILSWWARRTPNDIDDVIVGVLQWPVILLLVLTAAISLVDKSPVSPELQKTVSMIANILRIAIIAWTVWRLTRDTVLYYGRQLAKLSDSSFDDVLIPVLDVLAPVVIVGVGAILMLRLLGADISTVVFTTGGAAIIVGLALRDTMGNILGGLTLLIDTPFRFGDLIIWDNVVCEIRRIGLRVTTLYNTEQHSDIYVPNILLAAGKIINLTRPSPDLRVSLEVTVPDAVLVEQAQSCLLGVANANPYILGDLPVKLEAMQKAFESSAPESPTAQELQWGIQALSKELVLDEKLGQLTFFLLDLHNILEIAEIGGLSAGEKATNARYLESLSKQTEGIKTAMSEWAKTRTLDPHLSRFPKDRERLVEDAEVQIMALERHISQLRNSIKNPGLYKTQRLDDLVSELSEWLPKDFKLVTPAWKYPMVTSDRSSVIGRKMHLIVFVDDIQLEGFVRRARTVTDLNVTMARHLREVCASNALSG